MSRYSTIALSHVHAARARELASHLGIPVSALVSTLIDGAYENEFGIRPGLVTRDGADFVIEIAEHRVAIPCAAKENYAEQLRRIASDGGAFIDLDHPAMLAISRQGSAVVIETKVGRESRRTMGEAEAKRLADEIEAYG